MAIDEINVQESVDNLERLEQFYAQWKLPNQKTSDVWSSFRLLPLQPAYLVTAHYSYETPAWSLITKWQLYSIFDKALRNGENRDKISSSIVSALETQRKIVALEKAFAGLNDGTKSKVGLHLKDPQLLGEVLEKVSIAKENGKENQNYEIAVIRKMISLYKEGHPRLDNFFFKNLKLN